MAVLQTILIIILVYYGLKLGLRLMAPRILNYAAKKTQERFEQQFGGYRGTHNNNPTKEGDTILNKESKPKSNPLKKVGEYIDFEEID